MNSADPEIDLLTRLDLYFSIRHTARSMRLFADILNYDYDSVVIFLSVAEICLQAAFHLAPIGYGPAEIEQIYAEFAAAGLSVMTIGEITGIPRETVRRKVKKLVDEKYLSVADSTKNVFLPISVIRSSKFMEKFQSHIGESAKLVKAIQFYQVEQK